MRGSKLEFRHFLQQQAMKLVAGEAEKIEFNLQQICIRFEGLENPPHNYFRNAINSYKPFKETGSLCKVSKDGSSYTITLVDGGQAAVTRRQKPMAPLAVEQVIASVIAKVVGVKIDASHLTGKQAEAFQAGADAYRDALVAALSEVTNHG